MRATGVRSFQLKGTPWASGVVKRLDNVMMMVWASPLLFFTSRKPSAPAPPDLFTGIKGRGESLCFSAIPAISRAIWSAPPPVPAGITNSMGLVGSQAAWAGRGPTGSIPETSSIPGRSMAERRPAARRERRVMVALQSKRGREVSPGPAAGRVLEPNDGDGLEVPAGADQPR